jgi:hypothetical protein
MAYARGVRSKNGTLTKTQIFVANNLGTCQVMVYDTGDYNGLIADLAFHFDSGNGVLAWEQYRDNGETSRNAREVVKLATFHVAADGRVEGLPISARTAYRAPTTPYAIFGPVLSPDGNRLAFSTIDVINAQPGNEVGRVRICDTFACLTTVEVAFEHVATSWADHWSGSMRATIGHNADGQERIYFIYRTEAAGVFSDGDLVAVDNLGDGEWTAPIVLVDRDVDYAADPDPYLDDPSALSEAGVPDRVLIASCATWSSCALRRVDVYDAGTDTVTHLVGTGLSPSWTLNPSLDAVAPNVLVNATQNLAETDPILEIDLDGAPETQVGNLTGYRVDSAY